MNGVHDMGGLPADGINTEEHELSFFEKRVDAMLRLLTDPSQPFFSVDELRRAIESLAPDRYHGLAYYERWIEAIRMLLEEKGVLQPGEIDTRIEQLRQRLGA